jgi:hypothetical protein
MNSQYFVYKRGDIVTDPKSKNLNVLSENINKIVVAMVGSYNAMVSGLHLGPSEIMSYHDENFNPKEALISNKVAVPIKEIRQLKKHHTYEVLVPPSSSITEVGVLNEIEQGDLVFQVGVRDHVPGAVTVGVVDRMNKYINNDHPDESFIGDTSESGSGVFTQDGKLIGMTLGFISPKVMVAVSIISIILVDRPLPKIQKPWFYPQRESEN